MKTQIRTEAYQFSHGKLPRGRGLWAFATLQGQVVLNTYGTYSQAKKVAEKSHYSTLQVAP